MGFIAPSYSFSHCRMKWICLAWLHFSCLLKRKKKGIAERHESHHSTCTPSPGCLPHLLPRVLLDWREREDKKEFIYHLFGKRREGNRRILNPIKSHFFVPFKSGMKWKENFNMMHKGNNNGRLEVVQYQRHFPPKLPNSLERNSPLTSLPFSSCLPSLKLSFLYYYYFFGFSKLTN